MSSVREVYPNTGEVGSKIVIPCPVYAPDAAGDLQPLPLAALTLAVKAYKPDGSGFTASIAVSTSQGEEHIAVVTASASDVDQVGRYEFRIFIDDEPTNPIHAIEVEPESHSGSED